MRIYGDCYFFATEKEARAFMKELDSKNIGYRWTYYDGYPELEDFDTTEDLIAFLEEEDRYLIAALYYNLTVEEMEEKPHCIMSFCEEYNAHFQELKAKCGL